MTRNIPHVKKGYIVPIGTLVTYFVRQVEMLDEDASFSINEKDVFRCFIADALGIDNPTLRKRYTHFIQEYESFDINRVDITDLFNEMVDRLEKQFARYDITARARYTFTWLPNGRNVYIYEE